MVRLLSTVSHWQTQPKVSMGLAPQRFQRNFYATSSCGVCGKASIDAIRIAGVRPPPGPEPAELDRPVVLRAAVPHTADNRSGVSEAAASGRQKR